MNKAVNEAILPEESAPPVIAKGLGGFIAKFTVLKGAERELWLTFLIKLFIISAYSITNKTLILWLSSDLGFNDQTAGALVGWVWAPAMTVCTLLAGSVTDALGLRRTFFVGVAVCAVARSVMVFTTIPWLALAGGLFPLVIGEALGTPVLIAATRRYSTVRQRSIAFSIIYMVMNVGYLVAGSIFDYVRHSLGEYGYLNLFGLHITTYRALFLVSLGFELLLFPTIYFLRRGAEATDEGVRFDAEPVKYGTGSLSDRIWLNRIFEADLPANGLRVSKVRYPRAGERGSHRSSLEYQLYSHHHSGANYRRSHAEIFSVQNGDRRRSDLRRICFCYGLADFVVSRIGRRLHRAMDRSRLSGSTRKHSPLLRDDRAIHI
ncbi:MAG: hypothetical protein DMF20_09045, partial [Verrucomicrobia bacterium]